MSDMSFPGGRVVRQGAADGFAGLSFRVDARLKNLLLDIVDGYDMSMTELLLMALRLGWSLLISSRKIWMNDG